MASIFWRFERAGLLLRPCGIDSPRNALRGAAIHGDDPNAADAVFVAPGKEDSRAVR